MSVLLLVLSLASVCIFQSIHHLVLPLRVLNQRMSDVMDSDPLGELKDNQDGSSIEINNLYELFKSLISNRKFSNNSFLTMPDVLAVVELAQACEMFEGTNYKAAGVCYNNIANFQFKNGKYNLAAENYFTSIQLADLCLGNQPYDKYNHVQKPPIQFKEPVVPQNKYKPYYYKVRAHRFYQFAICLYKELKYDAQKYENTTLQQETSSGRNKFLLNTGLADNWV